MCECVRACDFTCASPFSSAARNLGVSFDSQLALKEQDAMANIKFLRFAAAAGKTLTLLRFSTAHGIVHIRGTLFLKFI